LGVGDKLTDKEILSNKNFLKAEIHPVVVKLRDLNGLKVFKDVFLSANSYFQESEV
jgi:hypothetical protein